MPFIFHSSCYSAPSPSCLYYCNHFHTGLLGLQFLPYTNTICPHWVPCSNILLSPCRSPRQSTRARAHTQLSLLSSTMQTKSSLLVLSFKALPPSSMGPNLPFPIISYHCPAGFPAICYSLPCKNITPCSLPPPYLCSHLSPYEMLHTQISKLFPSSKMQLKCHLLIMPSLTN